MRGIRIDKLQVLFVVKTGNQKHKLQHLSVTRMVMGNLLCKNSTEAYSLNKFWPFTYAVIAKVMQKLLFQTNPEFAKSKSLNNLDFQVQSLGQLTLIVTTFKDISSKFVKQMAIWVALISAFEIHKFPLVHSSVS